MRVLVVVHGFPPSAQGGAEIYAEQHARMLVSASGDDVHVLTRESRADRAEYAIRTEQRDGLTITWINNTFRAARSYEDSYRTPAIARIAARVIDGFQPHVAHVHHLTCLSTEIPGLLAERRVPVFLTLHDYWLLCHRGQLLDTNYDACAGPEPSGCRLCLGLASLPVSPLAVPGLRAVERRLPRVIALAGRTLGERVARASENRQEDPQARRRLEHMRRVCGHVACFLAPCRSVRDRFVTFGVPLDRIELSEYGLDKRAFSRPVSRPGHPPLRIGFLGSLMISKAPHVLLEAFQRLPPGMATLDLVGAHADYHGDTSYRRVLEPLLSAPGVRAHGPQPRDRVADLLASLDVLVVPSIWPEPSPFVVREALLTGLPVIGSDIGGIPETIRHEWNGLLVEPGNVEGLYQALKRLREEDGLLDRLRTGAAETPIRSLSDDVAATRRLYETHLAAGERRPESSRLAAVVLDYRTAADTAIAVASLRASERVPDVIVVDNDGDSECRNAPARWSGEVTCLRTGSNLGFAGGMNAGIRQALANGADRVLLVNSDVVVPPDCVGRLEAALTEWPDIGIVGPVVMSRAFPEIVASRGIDYNLRTGRMRHRGAVSSGDCAMAEGDEVAAVSGCLMLVAREVFERVGFLDERYFFGFEDIDFCLRACAAGFRTRVAADAVAYHQGGAAMGARSPRRLYFAARNHLMLAHAHAGGAGRGTRAARAAFIVGLNLAYAVKAPGGSLRVRVGATLRGIRDYVRGREGSDVGDPRLL